MVLNKEIKDRWISALNSGDYKQGSVYLNGPNGYCCLGVLCDLAAKDGVGVWEDAPRTEVKFFLGTDWTIPRQVDQWASISNNEMVGNLMRLNDNGATFTEIAKVIEAEL